MILFTSCTKEESLPEDNPETVTLDKLKGNYDFLVLIAKTNVTVEATDGIRTDKMVSISDYVTKNNGGSVAIDASKFTSTGIKYSIDTTVTGYLYTGGVLDETTEAPFQFTAPPLNSVAPFRLAGTDSLYFSAGFVTAPSGDGQGLPSQESRARFVFSGDTLIMYQEHYSKSTVQDVGLVYTTTHQATITTKMKKKK
jgi:hypothetical protein